MPGFERSALRQIHHHLHADRPFALMVAFGQAELRIELPSHRAHRPIAHHGQRGAHVHAGQEGGLGIAVLVHALIGQADPSHPFVFDQRFLLPAFPARPGPSPVDINSVPTCCRNCPSDITRPPSLCRKGGM